MDGTHHPLEPGPREDQAINIDSALPLEGYSSDAADVVGRVLDGRYLIESVLGRGAMAVVLGARHVFLGKRLAIKVLHPALVAIDEMKERFLREARATSRVANDSVVQVTDFGIASGGLYYLVMEQLDGENLLTWSERRGMASAEEVCAIGVQMCDALESIHAAGYVHRDIKPENVWVLAGEPGQGFKIKLLDLGIAALIEGEDDTRLGRTAKAADEKRLTRAGQTLGTVLYMSPEQALGNSLDGRSDIYAMGCILWELACDACAFEGTSQMDIMLKQMSAKPSAPSSINTTLPAWFDALVMKCLEKKPEDRFQSAREARNALAEHLSPDVAPPPAPAPRAMVERPPTNVVRPAPDTGPTPMTQAPVLELTEPDRRGSGVWIAVALAAVAAIVLLIVQPWATKIEGPLVVASAPTKTEAPEPKPEPAATKATPVETKPVETKPVEAKPNEPAQTVPPQPTQVTLTFDVQPDGTRVYRNGELMGATPLVLKVNRSSESARYELTHVGRVTQYLDLKADNDQSVKLALAPNKAIRNGTNNTTTTNGSGQNTTTNVVTPPDTTSKPPDGTELWRPEKPNKGVPDPKKKEGSAP